MGLMKRKNETELEHHKRLVYGKLVDKTLADVDYSELAEFVYGRPYASDVARRMLYGSRYTLDLLSGYEKDVVEPSSDNIVSEEIEEKIIELKKARQKFFDERTAYNKMIRNRSRQEELNDIICRYIDDGNLPKLNYVENNIGTSNNDMVVSLNDIHYGANVDNAWRQYNSDICKDMMKKYLDEIISISKTHKSENCVVVCSGDNISGNIHNSIAITNKENVIQQITGVSELISEFVYELSKHFKTVRFISVAGNHSRIEKNKNNDYVRERLDDLVEWYLDARLKDVKNVTIESKSKLDTTMAVFNVRGKNYCCVHGDFDGTPSKVQALQTMVGAQLEAIFSGHMHHNSTNEVQGVKTIMGGSFLGMDDYCVEKRIYGKPQQIICICDDNGVKCHYDIDL